MKHSFCEDWEFTRHWTEAFGKGLPVPKTASRPLAPYLPGGAAALCLSCRLRDGLRLPQAVPGAAGAGCAPAVPPL